jgi:hypothetical protein
MPAVFPASVHSPITPVVDGSSPVVANDVNPIYLEVVAIETAIGATPSVSTTGSGTFFQDGRDFGTVRDRISNVENGANIGVSQRVKISGSSIIIPTTGNIGLGIKSNGITNLLEFYNESSNTPVTAVGKDGWILSIDGGNAS